MNKKKPAPSLEDLEKQISIKSLIKLGLLCGILYSLFAIAWTWIFEGHNWLKALIIGITSGFIVMLIVPTIKFYTLRDIIRKDKNLY